ncbi:MAG: DNA repair protein RadA [Actinomycetota bacterium]|nr:DNA repair protein RadA [Actinomycetota bacterium]
MARTRSTYRCMECGADFPQWTGRCAGCGAWNTMVEERLRETAGRAGAGRIPGAAPSVAMPIGDVDGEGWQPRPVGIGELDRVLGGGLVAGSVTLLGGEPGIGKSTLLLQALASLARGSSVRNGDGSSGARCLLASAEESAQQVRLRAARLGALEPRLFLVAETELPAILDHAAAVAPDVLVVDSIQTVHDPELASAPGSVAQVRECAHRLVRAAKDRGIAVVLVGHVTKDGSLAGPRVLEHVVDTVLSFEGERHHALRLLRAVKHRFGPTSELGLFEMTDDGLVDVPDPGGLFLSDRQAQAAGSVVVPTMEGHRPLLVELQALVAKSPLATPRRSAQGLDSGRLAMIAAVLEERVGVSLVGADVYALAVGGVRVVEPAADLGLALALVSSVTGAALPTDMVACGEVGLCGELRQVGQTGRRLAEAARLGFRRAVVPASAPEPPAGITVVRAATLVEAIAAAGLRLGSKPVGFPRAVPA